MFDLRYHVASLAAVFIALVIGILVGVGLSGRGILRDTERRNLQANIDRLERDLSLAQEDARLQDALKEYERETYGALMENRLVGRRIGVVSVGSFKGELADGVRQAVDDAGGAISLRALKVPIQTGDLLRSVANVENAPQTVEELGRALADELLASADTTLWDLVGPLLVLERDRTGDLDALVVLRTAEPQNGQTERFLDAFYRRLGASQLPIVGAQTSDTETSDVALYRRHDFSTVDDVEAAMGRLALAVLLEGGAKGDYGVTDDADAVLPPVRAVQPTVE